MQLTSIIQTPSLPTKLCLRKFSLIPKMFYEIFKDGQVAAIKGSRNMIKNPIILDDAIEEPPKLPEDFEVDETDSKILASLYQKDEVYPNFSTPKGLALIINNREFAHSQYNPRMGTEVDESNIRKLLVKLGYQVERTHHNLSAGVGFLFALP
uniref:Caspase family p20 domain-containing protein n=1 Tax=Panagrolaimus sp. PS1159 TaxID=55785 RepID=A0AC35FXB0_9BILA